MVMRERPETEKILEVLRPYAANWSGSLGRGDLVVPQREIPRLINDLIDAIARSADAEAEVSDTELFHALVETQRSRSVQDQVARLQQLFRILKR
jgi:predicted transcriptional regulator